jgi:hypothetical protein
MGYNYHFIKVVVTSLDKPEPEISRIWLREAEARLEAYREGKTKGIPAEEIFKTAKTD